MKKIQEYRRKEIENMPKLAIIPDKPRKQVKVQHDFLIKYLYNFPIKLIN